MSAVIVPELSQAPACSSAERVVHGLLVAVEHLSQRPIRLEDLQRALELTLAAEHELATAVTRLEGGVE